MEFWTSSNKIYFPLDNRQHNYYIDFYTKIKLNESEAIEYLVEIKPIKDYRSKPILEGKRTPKKIQVYENELKTYLINNVKFETAQRFAESNNMKFIILNETNIKNLWENFQK